MPATADDDPDEVPCTKCDTLVRTEQATHSPDGDPYHVGCNPWRTCHKCGEFTDRYLIHRGQYICDDCPEPRSSWPSY